MMFINESALMQYAKEMNITLDDRFAGGEYWTWVPLKRLMYIRTTYIFPVQKDWYIYIQSPNTNMCLMLKRNDMKSLMIGDLTRGWWGIKDDVKEFAAFDPVVDNMIPLTTVIGGM